MKCTIFRVCLSLCLAMSASAKAQTVFQDSFESATMSATSADGFKWDKNNNTSIVTMNADTAWCNDATPTAVDKSNQPYAVYNNRQICNGPQGGDFTPKTGNNVLRVRYGAGVNWAEQRFNAGGAYPELWVGYWIRVPTNYYRQSTGTPNNNKWFNILMGTMPEGYSDNNVSMIEMQDRPGGAGSANINISFRNGTDGSFRNSGTYAGFITPSDAGRWMHVVYHLKSSSGPTSTDGIIRMYRKWGDEFQYELINELVDLNVGITDHGLPGWSGGYLMGYANLPYAQATEWLIDDFVFSTSSLIDAMAPPEPPAGVTAR